jgi:hypothetical protein
MAWLGGAWEARIAVAVDATALGSAANKDVEITIPRTLSVFWDSVDSDGYQIRITAGDGVSEIDWGRVSWSYANRTAVLKALGASGGSPWNAPQEAMALLWVYVGNPDILSDAASATATSSPLAGYVSSAAPRSPIPMQPDPAGRATPVNQLAMKSTEKVHLWLDISDRLGPSQEPYSSHPDLEELRYVVVSGSDGGSGETVAQVTQTRFVYNAGTYIRVSVDATGLTSGDDVTLIVTATTLSPDGGGNDQIIEQRVLVQVRDTAD